MFTSGKAMSTTFEVYGKPLFLDEVAVIQFGSPHSGNLTNGNTNGNVHLGEPDSSPVCDPECFDLVIAMNPNEEKHVTFRAISVNDRVYWIQKLNQAMKACREAKTT